MTSAQSIRRLPLVSVLVPCYNQSRFAYEALLSAKAAYEGHLEIIVINDGSTDSSTEPRLQVLAKELRDERCSIEIVSIANRGLPGARNLGIAKAQGDFVQFLDCDDLLISGKINRQIGHFSLAADLDVSLTDCIYSNEFLDEFERHAHLMNKWSYSLTDFASKWERGFSIPIHTGLFRRSVFENTIFDEDHRVKEDWVFWVHLVSRGARLAYIGSPGALYRVHHASLCRTSPEIGRQWLAASLKIEPLVREAHPRFLDEAVAWYVENYSGHVDSARDSLEETESVGVESRFFDARVTDMAKPPIGTPRVSILVPVYEHFRHLGDCLRSALAQMNGTVEIVLVEDCSRDERVRALLSQAGEIEGVVVRFNDRNLGISETMNRGIALARGEYIAFLDCDDVLQPVAIQRALATIDAGDGCDYFFSDRYDISESGEIIGLRRYGGYSDDRFVGDIRHDLLNGMVASHLKLLRRASILRAGGFDAKFSGVQDWAMALRMLAFGKFMYLPEPLYAYRVHDGTVTQSDRRAQFHLTNIVRRKFTSEIISVSDARALRSPKVMLPNEIDARGLPRLWAERPLILDARQGLSQEELWRLREFNSYFDHVLCRNDEIYSALLGYMWRPDALEGHEVIAAAVDRLGEGKHDARCGRSHADI